MEKDKGIPFLERAVSLDPHFAQAHSALAAQYSRKFFESNDRAWEEKAYLEIEKALSLDPDLADPHVWRANLLWTAANGFPHERAVAEYRRALALNPNLLSAHVALASVYVHVGLLDQALDLFGQALKLSPNMPETVLRIGRIYLYKQEPERALAELRKSPEQSAHDWQVALALDRLGRSAEARRFVEDLLRGPREAMTETDAASTYAVILAHAGESQKAEENIARAVKANPGGSHFHHAAYNIASAYALLGRKQEALEWLRRVAKEGMPCYPLFAKDVNLDTLRGDPDFESFLAEQRQHWERFRATL